MKKAQAELDRRVEDANEVKKINARDLNRIADSSQKRYSLFKGDITDESGGLNKAENMTTEELLKLVNG